MLLQQRGNKHLGVEGAHHELNLGHRYGNCFELPLDHSATGVHAHTHTHILKILYSPLYFFGSYSLYGFSNWSGRNNSNMQLRANPQGFYVLQYIAW
jgi:hypothetical protein